MRVICFNIIHKKDVKQENPMESIGTNHVVKIVHVVRDLNRVLDHMVMIFGIERPEVIAGKAESREKTGGKFYTAYRNRDIEAPVLLANVDMGSIVIEVVEPRDTDSPWSRFLEEKGEGIYSVVYTVDKFKSLLDSMESEGMPNFHRGEYEGFRYGYWDTTGKLGFTLGLQEIDG